MLWSRLCGRASRASVTRSSGGCRTVAAAVSHGQIVSISKTQPNRPVASIRKRIARIVADHVDVAQFLRDPRRESSHVGNRSRIEYRSAARGSDIGHEVASATPTSSPLTSRGCGRVSQRCCRIGESEWTSSAARPGKRHGPGEIQDVRDARPSWIVRIVARSHVGARVS